MMIRMVKLSVVNLKDMIIKAGPGGVARGLSVVSVSMLAY